MQSKIESKVGLVCGLALILALSSSCSPGPSLKEPSGSQPDSGSSPDLDEPIEEPTDDIGANYSSLSNVGPTGAPSYTFSSSQTYYVDASTGSDTNDGQSEGSAWLTLNHAAQTVTAGGEILIKNGVYREEVIPLNSGTQASPIQYKAYPGHQPIISGSDLLEGWASLAATEASNIFSDAFEFGNSCDIDNKFCNYNSVDDDGGTNIFTTQSAVKANGAQALKITFGGSSGRARLNYSLATPQNDLYVRLFFQLAPGYEILPSGAASTILEIKDAAGSQRFSRVKLYHDIGTNQYRFKADSLTTEFYGGSWGEVVPGQWHRLELRFKGSDGTAGGSELWLDGVSLGSVYNQNTASYQAGRVQMGADIVSSSTPSSGSELYLDDIKMSASAIGAFSPEGDAEIYKAAAIHWPVRQVYSNGASLSAVGGVASLVSGSYYQDTDAEHLYLQLSDDSSPVGEEIEVGHRQYAVNVQNKNYIVFSGLQVEHINTSSSAAFFLSGASYNSIISNTISNNFGSGVLLTDSSMSNLIGGNTLTNNQRDFGGGVRIDTGSSENIVEYNEISGDKGNGIYLKGDVSSPENNILRYNDLHDLWDSGIYANTSVFGTRIHHNRIKNIAVSGPSAGGNGIHCAIDCEQSFIYQNVVSDVQTHGISFREGTFNNTAYNNTIYNVGLKGSGTGLDIHQSTSLAPNNNYYFNNIVHSATTACYNADVASSVSTLNNRFDYNLCYNPSGTLGKWNGISYSDLASFRVTGHEAQGLSADPQFISLPSEDFGLESTSPALGAGFVPE